MSFVACAAELGPRGIVRTEFGFYAYSSGGKRSLDAASQLLRFGVSDQPELRLG